VNGVLAGHTPEIATPVSAQDETGFLGFDQHDPVHHARTWQSCPKGFADAPPGEHQAFLVGERVESLRCRCHLPSVARAR
jgi:hypothetical protein